MTPDRLFARLTPHQLYAVRFGRPARPDPPAELGDPLADLAAANRGRARQGLAPFVPSWFLAGVPDG